MFSSQLSIATDHRTFDRFSLRHGGTCWITDVIKCFRKEEHLEKVRVTHSALILVRRPYLHLFVFALSNELFTHSEILRFIIATIQLTNTDSNRSVRHLSTRESQANGTTIHKNRQSIKHPRSIVFVVIVKRSEEASVHDFLSTTVNPHLHLDEIDLLDVRYEKETMFVLRTFLTLLREKRRENV